MKISGYTLTSDEESRVLAIYEGVKAFMPKVRFDEREEILGIGEEGKFLFCYFLTKNDAVFVKFKGCSPRLLDNEAAISTDMALTAELFQSKDMSLKRTPSKSKEKKEYTPISPEGKDAEKALLLAEGVYPTEVASKYLSLKEELIRANINANFSSCPTRLKNALYRSHISSFAELFVLPISQIMSIPNFGKKCFKQLCNYMQMMLYTDSADKGEPFPPLLLEEKARLEKTNFIAEQTAPVSIDPDNVQTDFGSDTEKYDLLYLQLLDHINDAASTRLPVREYYIFLARLGVNESPKTLNEIGEQHGITRERVRQLVKKSLRRMSCQRASTEHLFELEYRRAVIVSSIKELSAENFLSFIFLQGASLHLIHFVCSHYLNNADAPVLQFRNALSKKIAQKKREEEEKENSRKFAEHFQRFITFPGKRRVITENDFARLKTEWVVSSEVADFVFNGQSYACASFLEQRVLKKLLESGIFKSIKMRSLKISIENRVFYPDMQCLTYDGTLVIIEVKPLFAMCRSEYVEKVKALRAYCEKYGFGYLVTDERGNSFEDIDDENAVFSKAVLEALERDGAISYQEYQELYTQTGASVKNLLTLIKKHDLYFSVPFVLKKKEHEL